MATPRDVEQVTPFVHDAFQRVVDPATPNYDHLGPEAVRTWERFVTELVRSGHVVLARDVCALLSGGLGGQQPTELPNKEES